MQALLRDSARTIFSGLTTSRTEVTAGSRRTFTYLNLFGFNTDAIVVNRVLPEGAGSGYFAGWRSIQARYEEEIRTAFSPLPILQIPLLETEVVGLPLLERVAAAAFGERDPAEVFFAGRAEEVRREAGGHVLDLAVPFVARGDVQLSQRGDELTVHVGSYKHKTLLSRTLAGRPVLGARLVDQRLVIRFGERPAEVAGKGR